MNFKSLIIIYFFLSLSACVTNKAYDHKLGSGVENVALGDFEYKKAIKFRYDGPATHLGAGIAVGVGGFVGGAVGGAMTLSGDFNNDFEAYLYHHELDVGDFLLSHLQTKLEEMNTFQLVDNDQEHDAVFSIVIQNQRMKRLIGKPDYELAVAFELKNQNEEVIWRNLAFVTSQFSSRYPSYSYDAWFEDPERLKSLLDLASHDLVEKAIAHLLETKSRPQRQARSSSSSVGSRIRH